MKCSCCGLASQVTLAAYEAAWKSMKEGMTQQEFGALVAEGHAQQGFQGYASVQVGKYSALPAWIGGKAVYSRGHHSID